MGCTRALSVNLTTCFCKKLSLMPSMKSFIILDHILVLKVSNEPVKNLNVLFVLAFLAPSFISKCFIDFTVLLINWFFMKKCFFGLRSNTGLLVSVILFCHVL